MANFTLVVHVRADEAAATAERCLSKLVLQLNEKAFFGLFFFLLL